MQISDSFPKIAIGGLGVAIGFAAAILVLPLSDGKVLEFYGAFTAAIVAAIAVVLGTYYQADLTRKRDDAHLRQSQVAEAVDLFLWLGHAVEEMRFIARVLNRFRESLASANDANLNMDIEQYREVVSSQFMDELKDRAKVSARISPMLGAIVAPVLYKTFLATDRVYRFRGAVSTAPKPTLAQIERHIFVTDRRISDLQDAQSWVGEFLAENRIPIAVTEDE